MARPDKKYCRRYNCECGDLIDSFLWKCYCGCQSSFYEIRFVGIGTCTVNNVFFNCNGIHDYKEFSVVNCNLCSQEIVNYYTHKCKSCKQYICYNCLVFPSIWKFWKSRKCTDCHFNNKEKKF